MNLGSPAARTKWRLPTALLLKGLIRPVSAIGKRYVMTEGVRVQYKPTAVKINAAAEKQQTAAAKEPPLSYELERTGGASENRAPQQRWQMRLNAPMWEGGLMIKWNEA